MTAPSLPLTKPSEPVLTRGAQVLTIVPHFECEEWLGDCLASITEQTRPPEGIVVVDDASGDPPYGVVREFPQVTLMTTTRNVGPYGIVQQVMNDTRYDAYMFQDADDWSAPERLELLLAEAERSGAELIGSHYCMVCCTEFHCRVQYFPRNVNDAIARFPTWHALQHPTSLVSRALVERLGGFAAGMRFSGDTEFVRRAVYVALVRNVQEILYFRRDREGSLTTAADTGLQSPARIEIRDILARRSKSNVVATARGEAPDLAPYATAPPVPLRHLAGPRLRMRALPPQVGQRPLNGGASNGRPPGASNGRQGATLRQVVDRLTRVRRTGALR